MNISKGRILLLTAASMLLISNAFGQETPKAINGGVLNGKAVSLPKPVYPPEARAAHVGGIVKVAVIIDEEGGIESAKAVADDEECDKTDTVESNSDRCVAIRALRDASEAAALQAKFSPTRLSGNPVKVRGQITYNFVSDDDRDGKLLSGGILNGKASELPNAEYPAAAKAVGASGLVSVQVVVDEAGNVIAATAVSGHPLLRASAVTAARSAKFAPTMLSGEPVKISGIITYNFVLPKEN